MSIALSEQEDQLCTLLDEFSLEIKQKEGIDTTCRIAGGWVRDKLLGYECSDIDIALSSMMGVDFATRFVAYCSETKQLPVKGVTKIESNPEQSKHLETATTTILGHQIDFVNLRSEEYTESSRIPTHVTFGTPLQDALRRDITINALFYNVHTRSVEDHIGKGLDDLANGVIRTPLPPKETFMDDPLRIVRCVRFASRFGFKMVPELEAAARDPDIQKALVSKISRERIGEEVDKMMKGRDPLQSIKIVDNLSLHSCIFHLPSSVASTLSDNPARAHTSVSAACILNSLLGQPSRSSSASFLSSLSLPQLDPLLANQKEVAQSSPLPRIWLASALTPYRGLTYTDGKGKTQPAVEAVIREGLKLGTQNHYLDGIPPLFTAWDTLSKAIDEPSHDHDDAQERVRIGLLLRQKAVHQTTAGSHWTTSLLFSLVQDLVGFSDDTGSNIDLEAATRRVQEYNEFVSRIGQLGLPAMVDAKTILDGRDVVRVLNASPGRWTGQVLSRVLEWQLQHPDGTKEQCVQWLKAEHALGNIDVGSSQPSGKRGKREETSEGAAKKTKR